MVQSLETVAKDDFLHAASTSTTRRSIAPTVTQVRSIDRVLDLVSLEYHN